MLKNKYQRLSRDEKKKAREDFYKTNDGKALHYRFTRLLIVSVLLILYGLFLIIETLVKHGSIFGIVSGILLFVFALVFLIGRHKLIVDRVNKYLLKKK